MIDELVLWKIEGVEKQVGGSKGAKLLKGKQFFWYGYDTRLSQEKEIR